MAQGPARVLLVSLVVRKEGANKGRVFYSCYSQAPACKKSFQWENSGSPIMSPGGSK
ncbi:hypothetical protein T484DRAFT_1893803 [Baffinella frigidus]|nr:hypothetical protein T484DRAFT_1893803 [Cryptophyta sp. CCMP2293]